MTMTNLYCSYYKSNIQSGMMVSFQAKRTTQTLWFSTGSVVSTPSMQNGNYMMSHSAGLVDYTSVWHKLSEFLIAKLTLCRSHTY